MKKNVFLQTRFFIVFTVILFSASVVAQDSRVLTDSSFYAGTLKLPVDQNFLLKTNSGHFYELSSAIKQKNVLMNPQVSVYKNGKKMEMVIQNVEKPVPVKLVEDVTETIIDGDFKGWDGTTVFKMVDGHEWKQDREGNLFSNLFRPKVVIYRTPEGYKMKVQGVDETLMVRRMN